ncbi:MAG: serine hydrolase [Ruminococcus sp.]|nr:serine hydrolase [Ruminococcus sp.]
MKSRKMLSILLSLLILVSTVVFTPTISAASKDDLATISSLQAYQSFVDRAVKLKDFSGVVYATKNGRVLCQSASGMQNTEKNIPMSIDSQFSIGSVSKQFCATAVLLLQEQGKLSVNDTLEKYFPQYVIGKDITIHALLSMRSGIRDYMNTDYDYEGHENPFEEYIVTDTATKEENQKSILDWVFTQELKYTPDSAHTYSNTNFLILSIIVEKVSGISYQDFLKQNIFTPLNMTNTVFYEDIINLPNLAEPILNGYMPFEPYHRGLTQGAGDLVSNAKDMDKWMTSLSEGTLLSEESLKAMTTVYTPDAGYCYGIMYDAKDGGVYHGGRIPSYETMVLFYPEENLNIFVVTNDLEKTYKKNFTVEYFANTLSKKIHSNTSLGDVDSDGDISVLDATAIQLHISQLKMLNEEQLKCTDTDADGELSVLDATAIQLFLAQL